MAVVGLASATSSWTRWSSIIAIAISLASLTWNIVNSLVAKGNRTRDYLATEFSSSVRSPIEASFSALYIDIDDAKAMGHLKTIVGLNKSLRHLQATYTANFDILATAIRRGESHVEFRDRIQLADLVQDKFDEIINFFNAGYCATNISDAADAIRGIHESMESLITLVSGRLSVLSKEIITKG